MTTHDTTQKHLDSNAEYQNTVEGTRTLYLNAVGAVQISETRKLVALRGQTPYQVTTKQIIVWT